MDLRELIQAGQSECIAWAPCKNGIHTEVFETICAIANTAGGDMLLGINEDGSVSGFPVKIIDHVIRGMIQAFENPEIFNPVLHLIPREAVIEEKHVIAVHIPESADVHTMRGKVYVRRGNVTGAITHGSEMARIYDKKSRVYTDGKIYPYLKKSDLDMALLRRIQKRVRIFDQQHPWAALEEDRLLEEMNLMGINYESGIKGLRFAAALLFGRDNTIQNIFAGVTFCIEDRRYVTVTKEYLVTNLLDTYERLTAVTGEVLGASRAAGYIAELLLVRDYNDLSPVTITMTDNAVTDDVDAHKSLRGNPVLERIFRESVMSCEIYTAKKLYSKSFDTASVTAKDHAEHAGNNIRNRNEESHQSTGTVKAVPDIIIRSDGRDTAVDGAAVQGASPEVRREKVLNMMKEDERIGVGVMAQHLGVAKRTILRDIDKMKKAGAVERVGPEKGGRWIVHL